MASSLDPAVEFAQSTSALLRVLAGPGTGKSYALTQRLNHLVTGGQDPSRIMVVTFARAAARDLITAASEVAGADGKILPSTLHTPKAYASSGTDPACTTWSSPCAGDARHRWSRWRRA